MMCVYRFLCLLVALFFMAGGSDAAEYKYRIRKRVCQMYDNCPTEDSSLKPTGYTATINTDPVTGVNQSLVSFTISGAQNGDLFNWTLDDANPGTSALSGNGSMPGATKTVSGLNVSSLSDGALTLRVEISRGGIWGNPVTDTATKSTGGTVFVSFDDGFDDRAGTSAGQPLTSNSVAVTGFMGSLSVSVSGDASAQVSVNGGACAASGTITSGQTISLCANSPSMDTSKTITVTVGASSAIWKISTEGTVATGSIFCWGWNPNGQLGDGTNEDKHQPVEVVGLDNTVTSFAASDSFSSGYTCAVHGGALKCWGANESGQLGNGSVGVPSFSPVLVNGMGSGVSFVAASYSHTCAVQSGALKCWGTNDYGQLGDGTNEQRNVPVPVVGMESGVTSVAAGSNHTCAIQFGAIKCWGANDYGQLGNATNDPHNTPVAVSGMESGVTRISAGTNHTCAIQSGMLKCWGSNVDHSGGELGGIGQLGDGTDINRSTPVRVLDANGVAGSGPYFSGVAEVEAGAAHTCAAKTDGSLYCWGYNSKYASLGDGSNINRLKPSRVLDVNGIPDVGPYLSDIANMAAGYHTCARKNNGSLYCWGHGYDGQLGCGLYGWTVYAQSTPIQVLAPNGVEGVGPYLASVVALGAGRNHTCAVVGNLLGTGDTVAPTISTLSPQPGSTDVAEDSNLVITFGEDVVAGTGDIVIRKLSGGSAFETIPVTDARVSIVGKVATINPTGLFASNTAYYVEVAAGAFKDAADNAFAGIAGSSTWAFTSEITDFAPPLVSTFSPANGATTAAINANLIVTFDEPVVKGAGNIVVKKLADGSAFETIPVSDSRASVSGSAATINPTGTFASGTPYYVEIAAGAFKDASANAFAGITGSSTWRFKTVPGSSPGCPTDDYTACVIDADGAGPIPAVATKCNNSLDGGGWSLIGYIDATNNATWDASTTLDPSESASKRVSDAFYTAINATTTDYMFTHCGEKYRVAKSSAQSANCMNMSSLPNSANFVDPARDYSNYTFAWTDPGCDMTGGDYTHIEIGTSSLWFNGTFFDAWQWNSSHYIQKWNGSSWQLLSDYDVVPGGKMLLYVRGNTAPETLSLSPADGASGVAADENLVLTFSKNVVKGTGNIVIRRSVGGTAVETIAVTDAKVSVSGPTATINPATTLTSGTGYYVEVDAGAFKDSANHSFAGISGSDAWNFTAASGGGSLACAIDWESVVKPELDRVIALGTSGAATTTFDTMGGALWDAYKFIGITEGNDGKLYASPYWSENILIIDTVSGIPNRSALGGGPFPRTAGGVLGHDGKIYIPPSDASAVIVIDTTSGTATTTNFGGVVTGAFAGGVLGPDCKIYMTPVRSPGILVIDTATQTAEVKNYGLTYPGVTTLWAGAVVGPDNKIYMIPASAGNIIVIDPVTDTAIQTTMGTDLSGNEMWHGAVLGPDGKIYGIPGPGGTDVLVIDPATQIATRTDFGLGAIGGYEGGVLAPDGRIYAIPYGATSILIIDPSTNTASLNGTMPGGGAWFGGVLGPDGKIYTAPYEANSVLVIDPHANGMWQGGLEKNSMYFNKF